MKYILHILFTFIVQNTFAQTNLVPNGSFEEYDDCPQGLIMQSYVLPGGNNVYSVKNWFAPTLGTSDYYNVCDTVNVTGVPNNFAGNQSPQNGNAYCGIVAYDNISNFADYREYLEVELKEELEAGEQYSWSFYVSLAEKSRSSVNKIGIALSDTLILDYSTNGWSSLEYLNIPDIGHTDNIIVDSINWTEIKGEYVAIGGEKHLLIGVFYDSLNIDKIIYHNDAFFGAGAYYYIDNVQLCKGECSNDFIVPNVFTPNDDGVNDMFTLNNQNINLSNISIYNRWGNQVYYSENQIDWDGTFNQKKCSDGVYFYVLYYYQNNQLKSKQGTIHLIR